MNSGMQHLVMRKRLHDRFQFFDYLMYAVSVIQPLALVPQIVSVWVDGVTAGISISTWLLLGFFNALWAVYGVIHRDRIIFIANFLMMAGDLAVVIGVLTH